HFLSPSDEVGSDRSSIGACGLLESPPEKSVVHDEHGCADNHREQAVEIQAGYTCHAEALEKPATDERTEDALPALSAQPSSASLRNGEPNTAPGPCADAHRSTWSCWRSSTGLQRGIESIFLILVLCAVAHSHGLLVSVLSPTSTLPEYQPL